jgi:hypothetical protein
MVLRGTRSRSARFGSGRRKAVCFVVGGWFCDACLEGCLRVQEGAWIESAKVLPAPMGGVREGAGAGSSEVESEGGSPPGVW